MTRAYIITVASFILAFTAAPGKAQSYQEQQSGGGPTDRFFQLLGIVAQVAPTILEIKGNQRIARIQAGAARDVARIEGRYSYKGIKTQSKAQVRIANIGAAAQRYVADVETHGNVRIAQVNAGATRYSANSGAQADIVSALFGYKGQIHSANSQSRIAGLDRNVRKSERGGDYELRRRDPQSRSSFRQASSQRQGRAFHQSEQAGHHQKR
jgi:hypothetical protein